jgi:hypothetical protein
MRNHGRKAVYISAGTLSAGGTMKPVFAEQPEMAPQPKITALDLSYRAALDDELLEAVDWAKKAGRVIEVDSGLGAVELVKRVQQHGPLVFCIMDAENPTEISGHLFTEWVVRRVNAHVETTVESLADAVKALVQQTVLSERDILTELNLERPKPNMCPGRKSGEAHIWVGAVPCPEHI